MNEDYKMPWKGIVKLTLGVAAFVGGTATAISAAEIRGLKIKDAEKDRVHWTDANRWERR